MSDNIRVSLATETLQVTPGESIQTEISIRNVSNVVDVFSVALTDLDSSWCELSADSSSLFPNDDVTITLTISPPKTSASVAKSYPFTVKVSSQKDATQQTSVSATLEVQAEYSFDVDLTPQKATGAKGSYTLNLVNTGNAMLTVGLEEKDPEDACRFYFNPQNPRLAPGEKAAVTTTVEPGRRPLTGAPRRITSP